MAVDIKLKRSHTHSNIPTTSDLSEGEFAVNTYDSKMYMRDGSNNIVTVANHYATNYESSTKTFYVTVATSAAGHVHHGNGSSNKYKINGVFSPFLKLIPGITYRFDQSDSSNSGHPFRFYLDENKSTAYTTGVTTNGTAGSSGAYTEIVVTHSTPSILHYQCSAHGLMGWAAFVNTSSHLLQDTTPQLGGNLDLNSNNITGTGNINTTGTITASGDMTADEYFVGGTTDHKIGKVNHTYGDGIGLTTDHATVTIGAGNSGYIHYMASGNQQHWFNQSVNTNAHFYVYSDTGSLTWINNRGTSHEVTLTTTTPTAGRTLSLPDQTGTLLSSGGDGSITGNLTLTSTDTSSSAAPILDLVRDSSSPADADYLGQIKFKGDDDGGGQNVYAKITGKIIDASAGTEDGAIEFANLKAGSSTVTARLRSDKLQLLNGTSLEVAGNTTLSGTLNTHTIPSGTGTLALTSDITSSDVSADSTPQLGGNLDVNGNSIVSASNGNITITPNGSGKVILDGLSHPVADGNAGQVLKTDGSGNLAFASVSSLAGSGIQNVSDDSSPQLGGNFDVVTHSIVSTSNRDINLTPNGSGKVVVSSTGIEFSDGSVQTAAGANQGFAIAMGIALG